MNEVQQLLKHAWELAKENGVILDWVDYKYVQTLSGEYNFLEVNVDGKLTNK